MSPEQLTPQMHYAWLCIAHDMLEDLQHQRLYGNINGTF